MAAIYDRQYRPITNRESAVDDGCSVRAIRELADSINNYKAHVSGQKLISAIFPRDSFQSDDNKSVERLIHSFAARWVPSGYNRLHWQIGGRQNQSATSCIWRLYCGTLLYKGPADFNTAFLGPIYTVDSLTINSTTHNLYVSLRLNLIRNQQGFVYLTLTAQNNNLTAGNFSFLSTIDATAKILP